MPPFFLLAALFLLGFSCFSPKAKGALLQNIPSPLANTPTTLSAANYAVFLNAVASSDPDNLYNPIMASFILRESLPGHYYYSITPSLENQPLPGISYEDATLYNSWKGESVLLILPSMDLCLHARCQWGELVIPESSEKSLLPKTSSYAESLEGLIGIAAFLALESHLSEAPSVEASPLLELRTLDHEEIRIEESCLPSLQECAFERILALSDDASNHKIALESLPKEIFITVAQKHLDRIAQLSIKNCAPQRNETLQSYQRSFQKIYETLASSEILESETYLHLVAHFKKPTEALEQLHSAKEALAECEKEGVPPSERKLLKEVFLYRKKTVTHQEHVLNALFQNQPDFLKAEQAQTYATAYSDAAKVTQLYRDFLKKRESLEDPLLLQNYEQILGLIKEIRFTTAHALDSLKRKDLALLDPSTSNLYDEAKRAFQKASFYKGSKLDEAIDAFSQNKQTQLQSSSLRLKIGLFFQEQGLALKKAGLLNKLFFKEVREAYTESARSFYQASHSFLKLFHQHQKPLSHKESVQIQKEGTFFYREALRLKRNAEAAERQTQRDFYTQELLASLEEGERYFMGASTTTSSDYAAALFFGREALAIKKRLATGSF